MEPMRCCFSRIIAHARGIKQKNRPASRVHLCYQPCFPVFYIVRLRRIVPCYTPLFAVSYLLERVVPNTPFLNRGHASNSLISACVLLSRRLTAAFSAPSFQDTRM